MTKCMCGGLMSRAMLDAVQFALAAWGIYEWSKDDAHKPQAA